MKKSGYLIIIWLVALLSWLAEKAYLNDYAKSAKFNRYSVKTGEILLEADQKLLGLTSAGQFNYLLWSEGLLTDELAIIKSRHPLIKDVLIFSPDFHLLAGTNDGFSDAGILSWLQNAGNEKSAKRFLAKEGYFHIYPITSDDKKSLKGFIVAVLKLPSFLKEGSVFALDLTRSNIYMNDPGYLNDQDQHNLQKKLINADMTDSGKTTLRLGKGKEIFWSFFRPLNIYLGYISDKKEIFTFVYFYVILLSVLLSILVLMKTTEKKVHRYEVYEQVIHDNIRTLSEMKKGMETLLRETSTDKIADVGMIREFSRELSYEDIPGFFRKQGLIAGETAIPDFILIDPLETKWYKSMKKKQDVSGKSARVHPGKEAFSEELLNLMKEVTRAPEPPPGEEIVEPKVPVEATEAPAEAEGDYRIIRKDPLTSALEKLYGVEDVGEELEIAVEYAKSYGRADGIAALFFDREVGCYTVSLANGLEMSWTRYFYLLPKDSVMPVGDTNALNLVVSEEQLQNPYFRKRIPPEFLGRLGAIKIIPVSTGEILIRVALFYWRDGDFFQKNSRHLPEALNAIDTPGFFDYFQEIMPALNGVYAQKQKDSKHPEEAYRDIYNILKSFTIHSDKRALVVHAVSDNAMDKNFRELLREKSQNILTGHERYIVNNPNHLIFLLSETSSERVEEMIREIGGSFEFSTMTFPELEKNIFAYL